MLTNEQIENLTDAQRLEILDDQIEDILAHPENWNQRSWRCKTGFCLAGGIVNRHGPGWRDDYSPWLSGGGETAQFFAERVLDINSNDYGPSDSVPRLFHASNDIRQLITYRNQYAGFRHLPARQWNDEVIEQAEKIARATNYARVDWANYFYDPDEYPLPELKQVRFLRDWAADSDEEKAYVAEIARQKRLDRVP